MSITVTQPSAVLTYELGVVRADQPNPVGAPGSSAIVVAFVQVDPNTSTAVVPVVVALVT